MYFTTWELIFKVAACFFRLFLLSTARIFALVPIIAVMFTFSFGTAMAATGAENLQSAQSYVDQAVSVAEGTELLKDTYTATAEEYAAAEAKKAANLILSALVSTYKLDTEEADLAGFKAEFGKWAMGTNNTTYIGKKVGDLDLTAFEASYSAYFGKFAAAKDIEARIAEAVAEVEKIDTSVYSEKTYTVTNAEGKKVDYTYRTYADYLKAEAVKALKALDVKTATKANVEDLLYGAGQTKDTATKGIYYDLKPLLTLADEAALEEGVKVDLEYAKARIAYEAKVTIYGTYKLDKGDDATNKLAALIDATIGDVKVYDSSAKEVFGVKVADPTKLTAAEASAINAVMMDIITKSLDVVNVYLDGVNATAAGATGTIKNEMDAILNANTVTLLDKAMKAIEKYEDAEKQAAEMKNAYTFDGSKKYDDAEVDAALAKTKTSYYENFKDLTKATNYLNDVVEVVDTVANAIADAVAKWNGNVEYSGANKTAEADKKYKKDFYDVANFGDDYDEIKADTLKALNDAKTVEEVASIMAAADTKLADLRTAEQAKALKAEDVKKYEDALKAFADSQKALMGSDYPATAFTTIVEKYNGTGAKAGKFDLAKDTADLASLLEQAKSEIAAIKTTKELDEMAASVSAMIQKLPASATVANEEAYMAANDALQAYLDTPGADGTKVVGKLVFEAKMKELKAAQLKAVEDAIKALPTVITVADKEAVEAAKAQYEKYYEYYEKDFTPSNLAKLNNAVKDLSAAEVGNVANMIKKLTEASSVEEVKAARDAYEALTGSQQRDVRLAVGGAFMYKLQIIEKAEIRAVESLKIKTSTKAYKGYIKVSWKVTGDAEAADGYQIYRSTKATSAGKKIYTTKKATSRSYKNSSVKKGTKYYYKVRAFKVVDGVTYYSDWSTRGIRTAK